MAGRALFVDMGTFARLFPVLRDLLRLVVDDAPFGIARSLEAFITVYVCAWHKSRRRTKSQSTRRIDRSVDAGRWSAYGI